MAKMTRSEFLNKWLMEDDKEFCIADALERAGVLEPDPADVPERRELWINVYPSGALYYHKSKESARDGVKNGDNEGRTIHMREVLPGDPEPDERVWTKDQVRQVIRSQCPGYGSETEWLRAFGLEE